MLTIEQVHQIIDACITTRMAVYFWTVYSLGLRMQEGLSLQTTMVYLQLTDSAAVDARQAIENSSLTSSLSVMAKRC